MRHLLLMLMFALPVAAQPARTPYAGPLFDAHLHYNDDAVSEYSLGQVAELFSKSGVKTILANSRPNDGTRALYEKGRKDIAVVPFIRVYRDRSDYGTWHNNPDIYAMIVKEHERGYYRGIGEFHVFGKDAGTETMKKIVNFAVEKNLVLHAHCDEEALELLFAHNPKARIIWAHTGFHTPLDQVEALLNKYPQMWGELSYRWDVVDGSEPTASGKLNAKWQALFAKYPTRFLVGSDTWVTQRWQTYPEIIAYYRAWLGQLPKEVAGQIAFSNGMQIFALQ